MDINTLRGLSTVFVFIAFMGICWWAFGPKRKQRFEEDANLPFADESSHERTQRIQDSCERVKNSHKQTKQSDAGESTSASSGNEKRDTL